jgi:hypothetical protein
MATDRLVNVPNQSFVQDHTLTEFQVRNGVSTQVWDEVSNDDQRLALKFFESFRRRFSYQNFHNGFDRRQPISFLMEG